MYVQTHLCQIRSHPRSGMSTFLLFNYFVVIQLLNHVLLFAISQTAAGQASLSFSISWSLLKLMSIESVMPSNHLSLCCSLLLLPWIFPSITVFSWWFDSLHQVAKVLELQLQHQSFQSIFRVYFLWYWLVWSLCCPRDSQESSPTPQFESINSATTLHIFVFFYFQNGTFKLFEDIFILRLGSPGSSDGKDSACNAGDPGSFPGLGRSPGECDGNPLQYSCLRNSLDRGAWWAKVHGVAKNQTRMSN